MVTQHQSPSPLVPHGKKLKNKEIGVKTKKKQEWKTREIC